MTHPARTAVGGKPRQRAGAPAGGAERQAVIPIILIAEERVFGDVAVDSRLIHGIAAVIIGLLVCLFIGFTMRKKSA